MNNGEERKAEIDRGAAGASAQESRTTTRRLRREARSWTPPLRSSPNEDSKGRAFARLQIGLVCNILSSHTTTEARTFFGERRLNMRSRRSGQGGIRRRQTTPDLPPLARLREEYSTLFRYTVAFPEFHRFMRQEAFTNNPRLKWVAERYCRRSLDD